jgi:chaperonin GroEL
MSNKNREVFFGKEATSKLVRGVDLLADAVKVTLGPGGRNVVISHKSKDPQITKDGVTVAREMYVGDETLNVGMKVVKTVASKTDEIVGDGTTTATVLAQQILQQGVHYIQKGSNAMFLKQGMEIALDKVCKYLDENKIDAGEHLQNVATISANGDKALGTLIADTYKKIGLDGVVTIDESSSTSDSVVITEGLEFDKGYLSPYMINNVARGVAVLDNPVVILYNGVIDKIEPLSRVLESIIQLNRDFLIVAEDIIDEALSIITVNVVQGRLRGAAVRVPGFGDLKAEMFLDIAAVTGATVVMKERGMRLEEFNVEWFGVASKIEVGRDTTRIINGGGTKEEIEKRIGELRSQMEEEEEQVERNRLTNRIAKLQSGVAILRIGAYNDVEMSEKKDRITDAINATRAALKEGIVPGGGYALARAFQTLPDVLDGETPIDVQIGYNIVMSSLIIPATQILENSGFEHEVILKEVMDNPEFWVGFDAKNALIGDMLELGVIDPVRVTKTALANAVSICSLLLTTECLLVDQDHSSDFVSLN